MKFEFDGRGRFMDEIVKTSDQTCWYQDGVRHREDGPAIEGPGCHEEWYVNGKLHRIDGPALTNLHGDKMWCLNGQKHREDGPAIEGASGYKEWWLNGKRHREDGPASVCGPSKRNLKKFWFVDDVEYTEKEFQQFVLMKKLEGNLAQKPRKKKFKP